MIPTGMVVTMISHASRSVDVSILRLKSVLKNAAMIRTQSRQKNTSRARALATWSPTMKASQNDSLAVSLRSRSFQPNSLGIRTSWPRLEIGKSSLMPWKIPITIDCRNVRWEGTVDTDAARITGSTFVGSAHDGAPMRGRASTSRGGRRIGPG